MVCCFKIVSTLINYTYYTKHKFPVTDYTRINLNSKLHIYANQNVKTFEIINYSLCKLVKFTLNNSRFHIELYA